MEPLWRLLSAPFSSASSTTPSWPPSSPSSPSPSSASHPPMSSIAVRWLRWCPSTQSQQMGSGGSEDGEWRAIEDQRDGGGWHPYDSNSASILESAFIQGQAGAVLSLTSFQMRGEPSLVSSDDDCVYVDFGKMEEYPVDRPQLARKVMRTGDGRSAEDTVSSRLASQLLIGNDATNVPRTPASDQTQTRETTSTPTRTRTTPPTSPLSQETVLEVPSSQSGTRSSSTPTGPESSGLVSRRTPRALSESQERVERLRELFPQLDVSVLAREAAKQRDEWSLVATLERVVDEENSRGTDRSEKEKEKEKERGKDREGRASSPKRKNEDREEVVVIGVRDASPTEQKRRRDEETRRRGIGIGTGNGKGEGKGKERETEPGRTGGSEQRIVVDLVDNEEGTTTHNRRIRQDDAESSSTSTSYVGRGGLFVAETDEDAVILESSFINRGVFPPWDLRDFEKEAFYFLEPFSDPDEMLSLAQSQSERFASWKRPSTFIKNPRMLLGERLSSYSITQSVVGDCSFLASLCTATNYERRFPEVQLIGSHIYPQDERGRPVYNPSGKYAFRMFWNGLGRKVIIDDFLPVDKYNNPLCAFSNSSARSELIVSLLEKAYMKVRGGYCHGSNAGSDMQILFGWIPENVSLPPLRNSEDDADILWTRLESGHADGSCMIIAGTSDIVDTVTSEHTRSRGGSEVSEMTGLLSFHAYACLDVRCTSNGQRLLKLRNPWAHKRWKGRWSEFDTESWTPQMQQELDFDVSSHLQFDNGIFWMEYSDVLKYFTELNIAWNPGKFEHKITTHGSAKPMQDLTVYAPVKVSSATNVETIEHPIVLEETDSEPNSQGAPNGKLEAAETYRIRVDPRSHEKSPQYRLDIKPAYDASVFILLTRHINSTSVETKDWMALSIYENDGRRVIDPNGGVKTIHRAHYTTSNNYLVELKHLRPHVSYHLTVMVCHVLNHRQFNYTLQVFSRAGPIARFETIPADVWGEPQTLRGKWEVTTERSTTAGQSAATSTSIPITSDSIFGFSPSTTNNKDKRAIKTAGGSINRDTFLLNPMYALRVGPAYTGEAETRVRVKLKANSTGKEHISVGAVMLHANIIDGQVQRARAVATEILAASSGSYREEFCLLTYTLRNGTNRNFVIVPSTWYAGQESEFSLSVECDNSQFELVGPLPEEGGGMIRTTVSGEWHPGSGGRDIFNNPVFLLKVTEPTQVLFHLQCIRATSSTTQSGAFAFRGIQNGADANASIGPEEDEERWRGEQTSITKYPFVNLLLWDMQSNREIVSSGPYSNCSYGVFADGISSPSSASSSSFSASSSSASSSSSSRSPFVLRPRQQPYSLIPSTYHPMREGENQHFRIVISSSAPIEVSRFG